VLAQQGVEKLLKACIYLAAPNHQFGSRDAHNLKAIARHVSRLHPTIQFADHELSYLKKLTAYFETKYPDSKLPKPASFSTAELIQIDRLFVRLSFEIPFDPQVKWRSGIFHLIGAPYAQKWPTAQWLLVNNSALAPSVVVDVKSKFEEVCQLPLPEVDIVMPGPPPT
jgi:hypothetical protein